MMFCVNISTNVILTCKMYEKKTQPHLPIQWHKGSEAYYG